MTGRIVFGLILSCAGVAAAQNVVSVPEANTNISLTTSQGGGASPTDYSVQSGLQGVDVQSRVSGVNVNANAMASGGSSGSQGGGGGRSGSRGAMGGSSTGFSTSRTGKSSQSPSSLSSHGGNASRGSKALSAASALSSATPAMKASGLNAFAAQSLAAGSGRQAILSRKAEESEMSGLGSGMISSGTYIADFSDSTRGTGVISPPDMSNDLLFSFEPGVDYGFPDLANHQFLKPTIHVRGAKSSRGTRGQEDLYTRIERRLQEYKEAEIPKNGLKKEKKSTHFGGSSNPFAKKPTEGDKLNKTLGSSLTF